MKTYVIILSRTFPKKHSRSGMQTNFFENLFTSKIHTIRTNYQLWKKRFEKIENGEACISIRYWSGEPYKSKQVEHIRLTKEDGIGLQRLDVFPHGYFVKRCLIPISFLAQNDGLNVRDFVEWFKGNDSNELALIHFTKKRY